MNKNKLNNENRLIIALICVLSVAGITGAAAILIPELQRFIIGLAEQHLLHRKVVSAGGWMNTLTAYAKGSIAIILIFDFFALTCTGKTLFVQIAGDISLSVREINKTAFLKAAGLLFLLYILGYISIIRANYSYMDDLYRAIRGSHWSGWSRHISDFLSTFIHGGDPALMDISPLTVFISSAILAVAGVLLVYILCDCSFSLLPLLASLSLGLSPYFLENISYKYDSPYMALSIFVSIMPFLFLKSFRAFIFVSVVSLLIMCMTYQAASGIYIMLTLMILFKNWNGGGKINGGFFGSPGRADKSLGLKLCQFAGTAALVFCTALVFFRLVFMAAKDGYAATAMLSPSGLLPGILNNAWSYFKFINSDFGLIWKFFIAFLLVLFVIQAVRRSGQNKALSVVISAVVLIVMMFFSYGVYIVLQRPLFAPRALYGFGVFVTLAGIYVVSKKTIPGFICVLALNYCFFVFSFAYGNALADQKRYSDFRLEMAAHDLALLFPERERAEMPVFFENGVDYSPVTELIARHYPVIKRLVPAGNDYHSGDYLTEYLKWGTGGFFPLTEDAKRIPALNMPVVLDSYYHVIKSDGENILVRFKWR
jgi:hypothetical protein